MEKEIEDTSEADESTDTVDADGTEKRWSKRSYGGNWRNAVSNVKKSLKFLREKRNDETTGTDTDDTENDDLKEEIGDIGNNIAAEKTVEDCCPGEG